MLGAIMLPLMLGAAPAAQGPTCPQQNAQGTRDMRAEIIRLCGKQAPSGAPGRQIFFNCRDKVEAQFPCRQLLDECKSREKGRR